MMSDVRRVRAKHALPSEGPGGHKDTYLRIGSGAVGAGCLVEFTFYTEQFVELECSSPAPGHLSKKNSQRMKRL